jgi:eukaryotic-like serine/threonine-protein kinase
MAARGDILGRYRLDERIGSGGMASVWRAHDDILGRSVAVKVISDALASDAGFVKRFRREAKVAAGLSHPNLVGVFDFGSDPTPYLVLEYVEGGTLSERLAARKPVDAERLASELLSALAHIHKAGVIHRDVKPANVLFDRDGRSRLTDFGIARARDATQLTDAGRVVGTAAYMAPEVRAGGEAGERSDLYSAGVLLGEIPRAAPSVARLAARLAAADPAQRPPSAEAALAMLGDGGAATTATAPLPTEPMRTAPTEPMPTAPMRRGRAAAIGLGTLAAAALAVALISGGDDGSGGSGEAPAHAGSTGRSQTATEATATQPTATGPVQHEKPAPAPKPTAAPTPTAVAPGCAELQAQSDATHGQPKPKGPAGKEAKDALKEQEKALKDQLKACGGKP